MAKGWPASRSASHAVFSNPRPMPFPSCPGATNNAQIEPSRTLPPENPATSPSASCQTHNARLSMNPAAPTSVTESGSDRRLSRTLSRISKMRGISSSVAGRIILQFQLAQLLHVGAAGAEDVADIGTAGQVAHSDLDQPALELEVLAHAADPERLAVAARRLGDGLERGPHALVGVLAGDPHLGREVARADMQCIDAVDRGDAVGVGDRLGGLDHRHQQSLAIDHLAHFGLWDRRVAELRAAAKGRAVALRRIEARVD